MLKFIGTVLVMLSGLGFGLTLSSNNKRHLKKIGCIEKMFCDIYLMLEFASLTYREMIGSLKGTDNVKQLAFLDVDENSTTLKDDVLFLLDKNKDKLTGDETQALKDFFSQLGETDLEGQLALTGRYKAYFFDDLQTLRSQSSQKCKLYNSLGALAGAFAAIMLQ